jgi:polyketide synthase PksN
VHCQGKIDMQSLGKPAVIDQTLNLNKIKEETLSYMTGADCYQLFTAVGLQYGTAFQRIKGIFVTGNGALARIEIPVELHPDQDQYLLLPSLIDAAFQSIIGISPVTEQELFVPFHVASVDFDTLAQQQVYYAYVQEKGNHTTKTKHYDILIADETGVVQVRISDLAIRKMTRRHNETEQDSNAFIHQILTQVQHKKLSVQEADQLLESYGK